jgi:hypothetical protein
MAPTRHRWFLICKLPEVLADNRVILKLLGRVAIRSPKVTTPKQMKVVEKRFKEKIIRLQIQGDTTYGEQVDRYWAKSCLQEITEEQYNSEVFRRFNKAVYGNKSSE